MLLRRMKELDDYTAAVAELCATVLRIAGNQAAAMNKVVKAGAGLSETNDLIHARANTANPAELPRFPSRIRFGAITDSPTNNA